MPINRPKHLDVPDEVTRDSKLVHIYDAHPTGKRLVESLIWLLAHYATVELQAKPITSCDSPELQLVCSAAFALPNFDED